MESDCALRERASLLTDLATYQHIITTLQQQLGCAEADIDQNALMVKAARRDASLAEEQQRKTEQDLESLQQELAATNQQREHGCRMLRT